jgi:hypothetical protein
MNALQTNLFEQPRKPRSRRPSLGHQHHEGMDAVKDRPRLETQFGRIIAAFEDRLWHTQYELAERLAIPQGSIGSQIRNARVDGYVISKRRRGGSGTWEYRLEGRRPTCG